MPGGEITFSGFGFNPNNIVELSLVTPDTIPLGDLTTDDTGTFHGVLALPALPGVDPGDYQVVALPDVVYTSITVLPAMTLDLLPANGTPGTIVHFIVNNLTPGQLRLDYDGVPVYGPVDVPAGMFEDDFLVPADRPVSFPQDVEVIANNTVGVQKIGTALTFFVAETPLWPIFSSPEYEIQITEFPPSPCCPRVSFYASRDHFSTTAGTPQFIRNEASVEIRNWASIPLLSAHLSCSRMVHLAINGHAPSLFGGDPLLPNAENTGGQVGVVFINKQNGTNSNIQVVPWLGLTFPVFKVKLG